MNQERPSGKPLPSGRGAVTEPKFYCSFCGKRQDEIKKLIAGPECFICDECVDRCARINADGGILPNMHFSRPAHLRKGQTLYLFLHWLRANGKWKPPLDSDKIADPFYIPDAEWDQLYAEFLHEMNSKKE